MFNPVKHLKSILALAIAASALAFAQTGAPTKGTAVPTSAATTAPSLAPTISTPAPTAKVGVMILEAAIGNTTEGKREFDALTKRFEPKQQELKALKDELDNLNNQYKAQADKLSDEEKAARQQVIATKTKNAQRLLEDVQQDANQQQQEIARRIYEKMLPVIDKFARDNGYTMIVDYNQGSNIVWASETVNVTQAVVDAYNTAAPTTAPTAPSASKPATLAPAPKKPPVKQ